MLAVGYWLLAVGGYRYLVLGYWQLANYYSPIAIRYPLKS